VVKEAAKNVWQQATKNAFEELRNALEDGKKNKAAQASIPESGQQERQDAFTKERRSKTAIRKTTSKW